MYIFINMLIKRMHQEYLRKLRLIIQKSCFLPQFERTHMNTISINTQLKEHVYVLAQKCHIQFHLRRLNQQILEHITTKRIS